MKKFSEIVNKKSKESNEIVEKKMDKIDIQTNHKIDIKITDKELDGKKETLDKKLSKLLHQKLSKKADKKIEKVVEKKPDKTVNKKSNKIVEKKPNKTVDKKTNQKPNKTANKKVKKLSKKSYKQIAIALLFVILFGSMISTAIYIHFMAQKGGQVASGEQPPVQVEQPSQAEEEQQAEPQEEEPTEEQEQPIQTEETEVDWTQFATTDFYDGSFPRIGVSAVTAPIAENVISAFYNTIPEDETVLYYDTTENNFLNLIAQQYDIVLSTASYDQQQQYGSELEFIPISNEAMVFLVSQKNSIQNLYIEDIQNIYSGQITTWENFTRQDENIIAYQQTESSFIQSLFYSFILPQGEMIAPQQQVKANPQTHELEKVSSYYDGGEYALGYSTYHYARDILFDYNIKMLSIDGIYPTKRNITRGIYPLMTNYYAVVRTNSSIDSPERILVQYLTSQTGQELIKQSGYIPLY